MKSGKVTDPFSTVSFHVLRHISVISGDADMTICNTNLTLLVTGLIGINYDVCLSLSSTWTYKKLCTAMLFAVKMPMLCWFYCQMFKRSWPSALHPDTETASQSMQGRIHGNISGAVKSYQWSWIGRKILRGSIVNGRERESVWYCP